MPAYVRLQMTSGEYVQMSGRAGRRGKDTIGFVITMVSEKIDVEEARDIFEVSQTAAASFFVLPLFIRCF